MMPKYLINGVVDEGADPIADGVIKTGLPPGYFHSQMVTQNTSSIDGWQLVETAFADLETGEMHRAKLWIKFSRYSGKSFIEHIQAVSPFGDASVLVPERVEPYHDTGYKRSGFFQVANRNLHACMNRLCEACKAMCLADEPEQPK